MHHMVGERYKYKGRIGLIRSPGCDITDIFHEQDKRTPEGKDLGAHVDLPLQFVTANGHKD
jgi:hypothetical protein